MYHVTRKEKSVLFDDLIGLPIRQDSMVYLLTDYELSMCIKKFKLSEK
jgi:hypothetical protein